MSNGNGNGNGVLCTCGGSMRLSTEPTNDGRTVHTARCTLCGRALCGHSAEYVTWLARRHRARERERLYEELCRAEEQREETKRARTVAGEEHERMAAAAALLEAIAALLRGGEQ
jgi:hypothetical protein